MSSTGGTNETHDKEFSDRVKKTFGNLFATISPTPTTLSDPLWSLSGAQVEKKEWRRDKDTSDRDNNPCSSAFDEFVNCARKSSRRNYRREFDDGDGGFNDIGDDDDEEGEEEEERKEGVDEWDLRGSIGLDSTLDHEDEEDTYDKFALGRENAGDRLYMRDISGNSDPNLISHDNGLCGIGKKQRDPRANLWAARVRLGEDDAEAAAEAEQHKPAQAPPPSRAEEVSGMSTGHSGEVKPILKRKGHETTSKPLKRVRFDPVCVSDAGAVEAIKENLADYNPSETITQVNDSVVNEKVSRVPDYVQNPTKYTCYSFDSTDDMNEKSNSGAYLDVLEMVKKVKNTGSGSEQEDVLTDLPKSVTFIPKKKSDTVMVEGAPSKTQNRESCGKQSSTVVAIALEEEQESEVGDMEVDDPEPSSGPDQGATCKKQGRQYRSKSQTDEPA